MQTSRVTAHQAKKARVSNGYWPLYAHVQPAEHSDARIGQVMDTMIRRTARVRKSYAIYKCTTLLSRLGPRQTALLNHSIGMIVCLRYCGSCLAPSPSFPFRRPGRFPFSRSPCCRSLCFPTTSIPHVVEFELSLSLFLYFTSFLLPAILHDLPVLFKSRNSCLHRSMSV